MICAPALLFLFLCSIQIILDYYYGLYNTAFIKLIITIFFTILFTFLLNLLCDINLGFIAWFIVLIPFFLMTLIVSTILFII